MELSNFEKFRSAYINAVVEKARKVHTTSKQPVQILDLCTGEGNTAIKTLESLAQGKIPFQATLTDVSYRLLRESWKHAKKAGLDGSIRYVVRDIANINDPDGFFFLNENPMQDAIAALQDFDFPTHDYKHKFTEGSFDIITGTIPFSSLHKSNYKKAVQAIVPFLAKSGSIVFTTGHSESAYSNNLWGKVRQTLSHWERKRNGIPFREGVNHKELDKYFAQVGFKRTVEPDTYTTVGIGHFHYYETLIYKRERSIAKTNGKVN